VLCADVASRGAARAIWLVVVFAGSYGERSALPNPLTYPTTHHLPKLPSVGPWILYVHEHVYVYGVRCMYT